jgi:PAS domain S-box-containing protein
MKQVHKKKEPSVMANWQEWMKTYTSRVTRKTTGMEPGQALQLEHILGHVSVGVVILNSTSLHIHYANPYILAFLDEPWCYQSVVGLRMDDVLPAQICDIALPILQQVIESGQAVHYAEVPYEGSLETRGRTYWRISIELSTTSPGKPSEDDGKQSPELLVIAEDVTDTVRSRLHLQAIHSITSAIAGPSALHHVLDRILQALQDLVGANRCAVLLIDTSTGSNETQDIGYENIVHTIPETRRATIAAQKGIHIHSAGWHPLVNRRILLGQVMRERETLVFTDTSTIPNIDLPFLDDDGRSRRPGSVLCVPIFEPYMVGGESVSSENAQPTTTSVLGTIEVYHRRPRGFPVEEVELLQRFAQQAGLAIQNARLFRSINRLARTANRNARQKENVMQAIPDAVLILDPRWRVADVNSAARKFFGWSGNLIGLTIKQALSRSKVLFPPELAGVPNLAEELERRALTEQIDEVKVVGADDQLYTMLCSYTPIQDEEGDLFAFIIIFHDVTGQAEARERIEAEVVERTKELESRNEALKEAKAAQELLLERLPSGVILVSAHNNTISVINSRAVQILQSMGLPLEPSDDPDTVARQTIGQYYEPLLRQLTVYGTSGTETPFEEQPLYRALHFGEASEAELHGTKTDGRPIYLLVNSAPLRSPDGTIASAILVLHEISRMKALEHAREDFFTTMAHELKTPLANIRAHLTALLSDDLQWSGEAKHDMLETADEQVERLVGMVNSFLDASRVEAGALRLEFEAILLPELLEDLQERLEALITSSGRHLQITLPEPLPAIRGDYELILSVLTNLLSNAFRYAPEGDIVHLEVQPIIERGEKQASAVTLSVTDQGPGMSQQQQMELFTRFSTFAAMRRPTLERPGQPVPERRRGGARWSPATGLGLYISRGIIEAHNSTLTLESHPGQGATFAFTLPVFAVGKKEQESEEVTS